MKKLLTLLLFAGSLSAQQTLPAADRVTELIQQLAAPKVRLRDEAQKELAGMVEAEPAMRSAMETHPSEEARLRLKRLIKGFRDRRWTLEWQQDKPDGGFERGAMRTASDGALLANLHRGGVRIIDTQNYSTLRTQGSTTQASAVNPNAPNPPQALRVLAFAKGGKRIAYSNAAGAIVVEDETGSRIKVLPAETKTVSNGVNGTSQNLTQPAMPVAAEFLPDDESLLVFSGSGLSLYESGDTAPRRIRMKELFPDATRNVNAQSMALSGDGKAAGVAGAVPGPDDNLMAMVTLSTMTVSWGSKFSVTPRWIAVNHDGSEALVAMRERGVVRCSASTPQAITVSRAIDDLTSVAYAPDEHSAFLTSARANAPVRQISLPEGDEIWTAPAAPTGCWHITTLGSDRIAVKSADNLILVWKRREPVPAH